MKYICQKCGFIYDEIATKTKFTTLNDFKCPKCKAPKDSFQKDISNALWVEKNNCALKFLADKCTNCGLCKKICENTVGIKYHKEEVKKPVCINCGQCILNCPFNALTTKNDYQKVLELLKADNIVTISIAPAIRTTIGEEFGLEAGTIVTKKLVTALKKAGFTYVFDLTFGADLTVMEEAMELVNRLNKQENLPLFTSCCPSWVKYAEIYHPELLNHLSSTKSPIMMQASVIDEYFFKKNNPSKKVINVMLAPCTAKKMEIKKPELKGMDYCLTTHEVALLLQELKIDLPTLGGTDFDKVLADGSGAGNIFGTSGGVLEATLRTAYYYLTGEDATTSFLHFSKIRGFDSIREASITILDKTYKVASVYGLPNLEKLLPHLDDYIMIEVMNCPNGCIGGGGQPKLAVPKQKEAREKRASSLYQIDEKKTIRLSYQNPDILRLYSTYLKYPGSKIAHELLHTTFKPNNTYFKSQKN